jgi:hypothetical protein
MSAESRAIATAMLLTLVCPMSPAVARSSPGTADHPWNPGHIDHLPLEIRNAISRLCGPSSRAAHYFATYSENSRFLNLHFEHARCPSQKVCTEEGCLHQVYVLNGGRYRLLKSYYGPGND